MLGNGKYTIAKVGIFFVLSSINRFVLGNKNKNGLQIAIAIARDNSAPWKAANKYSKVLPN